MGRSSVTRHSYAPQGDTGNLAVQGALTRSLDFELDTPGADELYRSRPQQTPLAATTDRARSHFDLGAFVVPGEFGTSLRGEF